jgi:hypothetical protein
LITEDRLSIEPKGVDRYDVANRLHLIIASNESWVVPVGPLERRFTVLDVLPGKRCDENYFNAIQNQLRAGGYEALLHELANYDLDAADAPNPRQVLTTAALTDQKHNSSDNMLGWWFSVVERGQTLRHGDGWDTDVSCVALYDDFCDYVTKGKTSRPGNINMFGTNFKKMVPGNLRKVKLRVECFDSQGDNVTKRVNHYQIPPHHICKKFLADTYTMIVEDPDDPEKAPLKRLDWDRRTNIEDDDDE